VKQVEVHAEDLVGVGTYRTDSLTWPGRPVGEKEVLHPEDLVWVRAFGRWRPGVVIHAVRSRYEITFLRSPRSSGPYPDDQLDTRNFRTADIRYRDLEVTL
jgi:hypothetical protein